MKVLRKKLQKVGIVKKIFFFLSVLLYLPILGFFIYNILHLVGVETAIRIIAIVILSIWGLIYILSGLVTMIQKKTKTFIVITIITLILASGMGVGSYFIYKTFGTMRQMNKTTITYTTNLIMLKGKTLDDKSLLGMIKTEDDLEGHELANKLIEKEKLDNKVKYYEDYMEMISDLYKGKIDGCFVSGNYIINFENQTFIDGNTLPIEEKVDVVKSYSEERENEDTSILNTSKSKRLTEPFTVLVMGVDSTIDGLNKNQAFNGDTLILVTFNPDTLTATMFSIPRDMYVPIACNNNRYAKINSSAAYGSSCVIRTVQKLTGIDIDYYVKINFRGVVDLVNALGGVTVNVEEPDFDYDSAHHNMVCEQNSNRSYGKNDLVCMNVGQQTLNGEQALAYARCRHLYAVSDIARNQHQQDIIEALAIKVRSLKTLDEFQTVIDTVSRNIETNMTPEQMTSFYDVAKSMMGSGNAISVVKTFLSYYSLPVWNGYQYLSALGYYQGSLDAITDEMNINLGKKKAKDIKTFSISFNEEYETPKVGYGIATGTKLQTMPSFILDYKEQASKYCSEHNINCTFEEKVSSDPKGMVIEQSVHAGVLMNNVSSVTLYVSDGSLRDTPTPQPKKTCDKDEMDEDEYAECIAKEKDKDKDKEKETEKEEKKEEPKEEISCTNATVVAGKCVCWKDYEFESSSDTKCKPIPKEEPAPETGTTDGDNSNE